jgi:hypothetical protein
MQINKKDLALLIVTAVVALAAIGVGIALLVKLMEQWRLVISFLILGLAAAGCISYDVYLIKKIKAAGAAK